MNGRVYNPAIGRFLSADPLINEPTNGQSYNRYSYVLNNPTNFTDPTGFKEEALLSRPATTIMGGGDWQILGDPTDYAIAMLTNFITKTGLDPTKTFVEMPRLAGNRKAPSGEEAGSAVVHADRATKLPPEPSMGKDVRNAIWSHRGNIKVTSTVNSSGTTQEKLTINLSVSDVKTGRGQEFVDAINEGWKVSTRDGKLSVLPRLHLAAGRRADLELYMSVLGSNGAGCSAIALACATLGGRSMFINAPAESRQKPVWDWAFQHEFGHTLGLNHRPNSTPSVMNYSTRRIVDSDIDALFKIYRAP